MWMGCMGASKKQRTRYSHGPEIRLPGVRCWVHASQHQAEHQSVRLPYRATKTNTTVTSIIQGSWGSCHPSRMITIALENHGTAL
jgi:hypothetical protein